jgi:hypothetical protein
MDFEPTEAVYRSLKRRRARLMVTKFNLASNTAR